jgi:hypothetical protein
MSNSFASAFDAMAAPLFEAAGTADLGTYRPCGGTAVEDCHFLVDRGVQFVGETSQRIAPLTLVTGYLAELGRVPRKGDEFEIDGETFIVDAIQNKDESRVICTVKPGE